MSIERRIKAKGKSSYRVIIKNQGVVISSASFSRLVDAEKWEAEQKYKNTQQKYFHNEIRECSVSELYNLWIEGHAKLNKAPSSVLRDKQIFRDHVAPFIATMKSHLVTPDQIEHLKKSLLDRHTITHKSINNVFQFIKALFNFGIKRRYLMFNPMKTISMLPVTEQDFDYWNFEETKTFLSHVSAKYSQNRTPYLLYLLCIRTGMRVGEVVSLKWDCVDLHNRIITVKRTFDNALQNIKETTKGKKIRRVGISIDLLYELTELKKRKPNSVYILENNNGNFLDYNNFRDRVYAKDIKEIGIRRIRIHDFRHTFASHYVMSGGTIYDLQQLLGHSDVKTTMRYAHLSPNHLVKTADIIDYGVFAEPVKPALKVVNS